MQTLAEIRAMLDERGLAPRKRLGQNFLIDHNLIRRLVDVSGVGAGDLVLEVGPGTGALTDELLGRGCVVIACELDAGLAELQRDRQGGRACTVIEGDCLAGKRGLNADVTRAIDGRRYTLVANLPYGAATPLMLALLCDPLCLGQHVTIQREVADRLAAVPGTKAYGAISVVAQTVARVERLAKLPPECFWPRPEVTSAMVGLTPVADHGIEDIASFAAFCQRLFIGRRKQVGKALASALGDAGVSEGLLSRVDLSAIDPTERAERLDAATIASLFRDACSG
ncbi:MAG: 16S rRNA (adenine(1518)-N(6)/adenine(1519)-N(6))-dimethyltransferase RsmA [Planctomycetota bacterium]